MIEAQPLERRARPRVNLGKINYEVMASIMQLPYGWEDLPIAHRLAIAAAASRVLEAALEAGALSEVAPMNRNRTC